MTISILDMTGAFIKKLLKKKSAKAHWHGFVYDFDFLLYCKVVSRNLAMGGRIVEIGGRNTGKTTRALHISELTRRPILTLNRAQADLMKHRAREAGLHIPEPIAWSAPSQKGRTVNGFIVDEAQWIFDQILRKEYGTREESYFIFGERSISDWREDMKETKGGKA